MEPPSLITRLDNNSLLHVFEHLCHSHYYLGSAMQVCRGWRKFICEHQLWRRACIELCPDVERIVSVEPRRAYKSRFADSSSFHQEHESRTFHRLCLLLARSPLAQNDCIESSIRASSTDHPENEGIERTLETDDTTYWSSEGSDDRLLPETLTYQLHSPICVIREVSLKPFKAYFQVEEPVYSPKFVRFKFGYPKSGLTAGDKGFVWTYISPQYPVEQDNSLQTFRLPQQVLTIGGILQVELLQRMQTQRVDELYYICISHVRACGQVLSGFGCTPLDSNGASFQLAVEDEQIGFLRRTLAAVAKEDGVDEEGDGGSSISDDEGGKGDPEGRSRPYLRHILRRLREFSRHGTPVCSLEVENVLAHSYVQQQSRMLAIALAAMVRRGTFDAATLEERNWSQGIASVVTTTRPAVELEASAEAEGLNPDEDLWTQARGGSPRPDSQPSGSGSHRDAASREPSVAATREEHRQDVPLSLTAEPWHSLQAWLQEEREDGSRRGIESWRFVRETDEEELTFPSCISDANDDEDTNMDWANERED